MFIALALIGVLETQAQPAPREPSNAWYRAHLPATIQVTRDVEAIPHPGTAEPRRRGTLVIRPNLNAFRIRSGPGPSRTYTITVGCTDALGVTSRSTLVVAVSNGHGPHE